MGDLKKEERCAIATRPKDIHILFHLTGEFLAVLNFGDIAKVAGFF